jgi:predicted nucleic acid-binding protein
MITDDTQGQAMRTVAVFDSSALIVVAKLNAIADWRIIYEHLALPPAVEQECIGASGPQGSEDALRIQTALQAGTLARLTLTAAQLKQANEWHARSRLGRGECQVLAYVHAAANTIAIIEDKRARSLARAHQIPYTTIQMSPLEGYIRKTMAYARAAELISQVATAMHTDLAVFNALELALKVLATERGEIHGTIQD